MPATKKGEGFVKAEKLPAECADKFKRQPLPMKQRALPNSFWQQPNLTDEIAGSVYISPYQEGKDPRSPIHSLVIGAPNTELLFSLFKGLPAQEDGKELLVRRRGRPKKKKVITTLSPTPIDLDPYVTSVAAPEVKIQLEVKAEGRKALALMSLHAAEDDTSLQSKFCQCLDDLVVNL